MVPTTQLDGSREFDANVRYTGQGWEYSNPYACLLVYTKGLVLGLDLLSNTWSCQEKNGCCSAILKWSILWEMPFISLVK